jgi:hypothetical protein
MGSAMDIQDPPPARSDVDRGRPPLPQGYRQGLITAITVLLGFSLSFLRYWGIEAPGTWAPLSAAAALAVVTAILVQLLALHRSLRVADDEEGEFRKTVRWLLAGALVLVAGLTLALFADPGATSARH